MPFVLMIFLTVACLETWQEPALVKSPALSTALTWAAAGVAALTSFAAARHVCRRLERDPTRRDRLLRRYECFRFWHPLLLLAVFGVSLYAFGWGWAVDGHFLGVVAPNEQGRQVAVPRHGAEPLLLAPYFAALVLSWVFFFDADRAAYLASHGLLGAQPFARALLEQPAAPPARRAPPFGGRWSYVVMQARQKLALVFLPVVLLIVWQEAARLAPDEWVKQWGNWIAAAGAVGMAAVFVVLPWLVRLVLGLRPLPAGPTRDRLTAAARRLRFRCSDLLLWDTRGGMANALVIGVVPWLRYVVFTDRLLEEFTPDEVEAVFGHEVGHYKHHHMLYYLGFLVLSLCVFLAGSVVVQGWLSPSEVAGKPAPSVADAMLGSDATVLGTLPAAAVLLAYIFVVFGLLSRRCERQADIFGCKAVSCRRPDCVGHGPDVELAPDGCGLCPTGVETFVRALEKVALVNGISRRRPGFLQSWQHGSIARRVAFLQGLLRDPGVEPRFQRGTAWLKWGLFGVLGGALALLLLAWPPDGGDKGSKPGEPPPAAPAQDPTAGTASAQQAS
jgi:Zn-dependent protease with chaperone function